MNVSKLGFEHLQRHDVEFQISIKEHQKIVEECKRACLIIEEKDSAIECTENLLKKAEEALSQAQEEHEKQIFQLKKSWQLELQEQNDEFIKVQEKLKEQVQQEANALREKNNEYEEALNTIEKMKSRHIEEILILKAENARVRSDFNEFKAQNEYNLKKQSADSLKCKSKNTDWLQNLVMKLEVEVSKLKKELVQSENDMLELGKAHGTKANSRDEWSTLEKLTAEKARIEQEHKDEISLLRVTIQNDCETQFEQKLQELKKINEENLHQNIERCKDMAERKIDLLKREMEILKAEINIKERALSKTTIKPKLSKREWRDLKEENTRIKAEINEMKKLHKDELAFVKDSARHDYELEQNSIIEKLKKNHRLALRKAKANARMNAAEISTRLNSKISALNLKLSRKEKEIKDLPRKLKVDLAMLRAENTMLRKRHAAEMKTFRGKGDFRKVEIELGDLNKELDFVRVEYSKKLRFIEELKSEHSSTIVNLRKQIQSLTQQQESKAGPLKEIGNKGEWKLEELISCSEQEGHLSQSIKFLPSDASLFSSNNFENLRLRVTGPKMEIIEDRKKQSSQAALNVQSKQEYDRLMRKIDAEIEKIHRESEDELKQAEADDVQLSKTHEIELTKALDDLTGLSYSEGKRSNLVTNMIAEIHRLEAENSALQQQLHVDAKPILQGAESDDGRTDGNLISEDPFLKSGSPSLTNLFAFDGHRVLIDVKTREYLENRVILLERKIQNYKVINSMLMKKLAVQRVKRSTVIGKWGKESEMLRRKSYTVARLTEVEGINARRSDQFAADEQRYLMEIDLLKDQIKALNVQTESKGRDISHSEKWHQAETLGVTKSLALGKDRQEGLLKSLTLQLEEMRFKAAQYEADIVRMSKQQREILNDNTMLVSTLKKKILSLKVRSDEEVRFFKETREATLDRDEEYVNENEKMKISEEIREIHNAVLVMKGYITELSAEIKLLGIEKSFMQEKNEKKIEDLEDEMEKILEDHESELEKAELEMQNLSKQLEKQTASKEWKNELQSTLHESEKKVKDLTTKLDEYHLIAKELNIKLNEAQLEVDKQKKQQHELADSHRSEKASLDQELIDLKKLYLDSLAEIQKTQKELDILRKTVKKITDGNKEKINNSEKEITNLKSQLFKINKDCDSIRKEKKAQIGKWVSKIAKTKKEIVKAFRLVDGQRKQFDHNMLKLVKAHGDEIADYQAEISGLNARETKYEEEIYQLLTKFQTQLNEKDDDLQHQQEVYEGKRDELQKLIWSEMENMQAKFISLINKKNLEIATLKERLRENASLSNFRDGETQLNHKEPNSALTEGSQDVKYISNSHFQITNVAFTHQKVKVDVSEEELNRLLEEKLRKFEKLSREWDKVRSMDDRTQTKFAFLKKQIAKMEYDVIVLRLEIKCTSDANEIDIEDFAGNVPTAANNNIKGKEINQKSVKTILELRKLLDVLLKDNNELQIEADVLIRKYNVVTDDMKEELENVLAVAETNLKQAEREMHWLSRREMDHLEQDSSGKSRKESWNQLDLFKKENEILRNDIVKLRKLNELLKVNIEESNEEVLYAGAGDTIVMHSQEAIHDRGEERATPPEYIRQLEKELAILKLRLHNSQNLADISTDEIKVSRNSLSKTITGQPLSLTHVESENDEVKVSGKLISKPATDITIEYDLQQVLDLEKVPHMMQDTNIKETRSQAKKVVVERRMSQNEYMQRFNGTKKRASIVKKSTYDLVAFTMDVMPSPTSTKTILPMCSLPSPTSTKKTFPIPQILETADEYQALRDEVDRLKLENDKLEENIAMQEELISKLRTKITDMGKEVYYVGKGDTIVLHTQKSKPSLCRVGLPASSEHVKKLEKELEDLKGQLYKSISQVAMINPSKALHLKKKWNHDFMDIMLINQETYNNHARSQNKIASSSEANREVKKNGTGVHNIQNPVTMRQMLAEAGEYDLIAGDSSDEVLSMGGFESKVENRLSAKSQRSPLDHQNELDGLRAKNEVIENNSYMWSKIIEMLKSDLEEMQNEKWVSDGITFDKIPTKHDFAESKSGYKLQKRKGTNTGAKPRNVAGGLEEILLASWWEQESTFKSLKQIRRERDKALKRCKKHQQYIKTLQKENKRRLAHIRTLEEKMEDSLYQSRRAKSLSFHKLKKDGIRIDVEKIMPYRPNRQNEESEASGDSEILRSDVEDENDSELRIRELQQLKLQVLKLERDGLLLNPEIRSLVNESKSETCKTPIHIEDLKKELDLDYWKTAVGLNTELEAKYSKAERTISKLKSTLAQTEQNLAETLVEIKGVKLERGKALKLCTKWRKRYDALETENARLKSQIRHLEESLQALKKNSAQTKHGGSKRGYEKKEAEDFERYLKSEKGDLNQRINPSKREKSRRFSFRWGKTPNKWKHSKTSRHNSKQQTSHPFEDDWEHSKVKVRVNADDSKHSSKKHKSLVLETRDNSNSPRQGDKIEKRRPRSIYRSSTERKISSTHSPSERSKRSRSSRILVKSSLEQRDHIKKVSLRSVSTSLQNS